MKNTFNSKLIKTSIKNNKLLIIFVALMLIIIIVFLFWILNKKDNFQNKIKIIPDIIGGIGNQLFIIATAYAIAKQYNLELVLNYKDKIYSYGAPRENSYRTILHKIPIDKSITDEEINDFSKTYKLSEIDIKNLKQKIGDIGNKNIYLTNGYYQEYNYFNNYYKDIINLFSPDQITINKINEFIKLNNIDNRDKYKWIAIHIRLEDLYTPNDKDKRVYDKQEYDSLIKDLTYYKNNSDKKIVFLVFTNDIEQCKDKFSDRIEKMDIGKILYVSMDDYIELALMSNCDAYIATPSTFNWWGIYLNSNINKEIYIYWKKDTDYRRDFFKKYSVFKNIIDKTDLINNENLNNNVCLVSGYWNVKNKNDKKYNNWFKNTLSINAPYVFFCNQEIKNWILNNNFRKNYPTYYVEKDINNFKTNKLNIKNKINDIHVPSKELGLIWLEKMYLLQEASYLNPYNAEWFMWIDAGISILRENNIINEKKFPNENKLYLLSKTQINYSSSDFDLPQEGILNWEYTHAISAGCFVLHKDIINNMVNIFYQYLHKCITETDSYVCYSEQIIFTRMIKEHPELFNKIASGYGSIINILI